MTQVFFVCSFCVCFRSIYVVFIVYVVVFPFILTLFMLIQFFFRFFLSPLFFSSSSLFCLLFHSAVSHFNIFDSFYLFWVLNIIQCFSFWCTPIQIKRRRKKIKHRRWWQQHTGLSNMYAFSVKSRCERSTDNKIEMIRMIRSSRWSEIVRTTDRPNQLQMQCCPRGEGDAWCSERLRQSSEKCIKIRGCTHAHTPIPI